MLPPRGRVAGALGRSRGRRGGHRSTARHRNPPGQAAGGGGRDRRLGGASRLPRHQSPAEAGQGTAGGCGAPGSPRSPAPPARLMVPLLLQGGMGRGLARLWLRSASPRAGSLKKTLSQPSCGRRGKWPLRKGGQDRYHPTYICQIYRREQTGNVRRELVEKEGSRGRKGERSDPLSHL
jgi:hypothetical protein